MNETKFEDRYSRQIRLPQIGEAGQAKLRDARVLIIGMGGLGSPVALYLAAAGVGFMRIADFDQVDESNLQRQIIHQHDDIGELKAESAARSLHAINPDIEIETLDYSLNYEDFLEQSRDTDLIVDCTDNFPTRYLTNDACVLLNKPNVYGSIFRFEGQASVFAPHLGGPCYRCLYPEPPPPGMVPSCAEGGVLHQHQQLIGQTVRAFFLIEEKRLRSFCQAFVEAGAPISGDLQTDLNDDSNHVSAGDSAADDSQERPADKKELP